MRRIIHPWKVIVYVSLAGVASLTSILALVGPVADESDFFSYYVNLIVGPVGNALLNIIAFCFVTILGYVAFSLIANAFYHKRDPKDFLSWPFLFSKLKALGAGVIEIILVAGPVILVLIFVSLSMSYINPVNATRLIDNQVVEWDRAMTGGYPFLILQNIHYPDWFIFAVRFSFMNLPIFLIGLAGYAFFCRRKIFDEMATVFCLSLVIMIFLWQLFPVLSPHDRFIDNVYQLPTPPQLEGIIYNNYHPQPLLQEFLKTMRNNKNQSLHGTMPTSTLPSAHVAWATLIVYYAYRVRKSFLIILLPISVLSTIGTVLFAQHYFVDMPAGVIVMALSIYLVQLIEASQIQIPHKAG